MGRTSTVWKRGSRGYYSTVHGRQVYLSHDAKEARRILAAKLRTSKPIFPGQFNVKQLVDMFLAERSARVAKGTLSGETLKVSRSYLLRWAEACRRLKPEVLRVYHVDAWVASHANWSSNTQADAIAAVKVWSRWAKRKGLIEVNHLFDAQPPTRTTRDAADPEDLLRLERKIADPAFVDWYAVLYDTGCRPGELCNLEADHLNLIDCTAQVSGKSGKRLIGVTQRSCNILKRLSLIHPTGPLLRTASGAEWSPSNVRYHWTKWRKIANAPKTLVAYHCRHALWARWHAVGISDIVISRQLGHFSKGIPHIRLLQSTYAHAEGTILAEAAEKASAVNSKRKAK